MQLCNISTCSKRITGCCCASHVRSSSISSLVSDESSRVNRSQRIAAIRHLKSPFAPKLIKFETAQPNKIDENYVKANKESLVNVERLEEEPPSFKAEDSSRFVDTNIVMQTEPTGDVSSNDKTETTAITTSSITDSTTVSMVIPIKSFDRL